jgi:hypothetical protein
MGEMPAWFDRLRNLNSSRGTPEKLLGVPATRRVKNYAALSGYVYEYYFEGYRDRPGGREFVFSIAGDRKSWFASEVRLAAGVAEAWQREREFALGDRDLYALAKLALFSAFDERANPSEMRGPVDVSPAMAVELLEKLDL